jgi:hypothetical protein
MFLLKISMQVLLLKCTRSYDRILILLLNCGHILMDIFQQGSAEVIFTRRSEAVAALKRYNNVRLDGKPMKIEVIGADLGMAAPSAPRVSVVPGARGRGQREVVMMYGSFLLPVNITNYTSWDFFFLFLTSGMYFF